MVVLTQIQMSLYLCPISNFLYSLWLVARQL